MKTFKLKPSHILITAVVLMIGILGYFQLCSHSPHVDNRMAKLSYTFKGHKTIVTAVRFSNNDSFLIMGSVDSTIKIWKRNTGEVVKQLKQPQGISYLDVSRDGKLIATGSYDSIVRIWNADNGELL